MTGYFGLAALTLSLKLPLLSYAPPTVDAAPATEGAEGPAAPSGGASAADPVPRGDEPAASSAVTAQAQTSDPEPPSDLGEASNGGRDSGAFELGLGSVLLVAGSALVVTGAFDLRSAIERRDRCAQVFESSCSIDPPGLIFASSALAFTFALPAFVGGALLLHKGVKINRDFRALQRLDPAVGFALPAGVRRGARGTTLSLRLRF